MYGQTETGAITFTPLAEEGKPGTIGRPSPQYDVRIVDDDDRDVAVGTPGEVIVRSKVDDVLYTGYWNKPDDDGGGDARRVASHRRPRASGRRGLPHVRRPQEGRGPAPRRERVVGAARDGDRRAPEVTEAAVVAVPSTMTEDDIKVCVVCTQDDHPGGALRVLQGDAAVLRDPALRRGRRRVTEDGDDARAEAPAARGRRYVCDVGLGAAWSDRGSGRSASRRTRPPPLERPIAEPCDRTYRVERPDRQELVERVLRAR